jgi:hypothetical protein
LASAGLSISRPDSVFDQAERGSKFIEPTNSRWLSNTATLACRRRNDRPKLPNALTSRASVGLTS